MVPDIFQISSGMLTANGVDVPDRKGGDTESQYTKNRLDGTLLVFDGARRNSQCIGRATSPMVRSTAVDDRSR